MSGRYVRLEPGRYTLDVSDGEGPAGIQRGGDGDVRVGIDGGRATFRVASPERVYYWWRGPDERAGVRLIGVSSQTRDRTREQNAEGTWPRATG